MTARTISFSCLPKQVSRTRYRIFLRNQHFWFTDKAQSVPDRENLLDFIWVPMVWLSDHRTEEVPMTSSRGTVRLGGYFAEIISWIVVLMSGLSLACVCSLAQSTAGRVLGTVTDQTGASVSGATVIVTDTQRGTSRSLATDPSGDYAAPDLMPGTYKIRVEAKGFKSTERPSVTVEVATDVRADFSLQPGNVSE